MKTRDLLPWLLSSAVVAGVGFAVLDCGGAVCGNGIKEGDELCDNGAMNGQPGSNCSASCQPMGIQRATLRVGITRLANEVPDYSGAPCQDLGADKVHIVLTGPEMHDDTSSCTQPGSTYDGITPGTYSAEATLLDMGGNPITKTVKSMMVQAVLGQDVSTTINFAYGDFLNSYTGRYDFTTSWGSAGKGCNDVAPPVTAESLKLMLPGTMTPVAGMTADGLKLDGTSGTCFVKSGTASYQSIANLNWGHYDLIVHGTAGGSTAYCQKIDIFVGPGVANPTFDLLVGAASATDGGVACP